jgi:uncharacterized protein YkwD
VLNGHPHRIATLALALATLTIAAPAASAHHGRPDPVAHMALRSSACANANAPATQATKQAMRKAVVCLINKQRSSRHLPALTEQSQLERSAQGWTNKMVTHDDFTHGAAFWTRIQATGFDWQFAGENIASGFATPQQVVTAWMGSEGHCRNILDPQYLSVGTGVSSRPVASAASGAATWTQDFGTTLAQHAPSANWAPANGCPHN